MIRDHLFLKPDATSSDPLSIFCAFAGHGYPLPCEQDEDAHQFRTEAELQRYFDDLIRSVRTERPANA